MRLRDAATSEQNNDQIKAPRRGYIKMINQILTKYIISLTPWHFHPHLVLFLPKALLNVGVIDRMSCQSLAPVSLGGRKVGRDDNITKSPQPTITILLQEE